MSLLWSHPYGNFPCGSDSEICESRDPPPLSLERDLENSRDVLRSDSEICESESEPPSVVSSLF